MKRYIGKRALSGLLVVLLSVCFNFTLIRLAPGDPIRIMAGTDNPNEEMIEALQQKYGLDKSIPEQFVMFLGNVAKGDLGYSYISDESVIKLIGEKIGPTLALRKNQGRRAYFNEEKSGQPAAKLHKFMFTSAF